MASTILIPAVKSAIAHTNHVEQRIEVQQLQPADIIVTRSSSFPSWLIRIVNFSNVSHAMLYIGKGMVVEALTETGVTCRPLSQALASSTRSVAYRYPGLTTSKAKLIVGFANSKAAQKAKYDFTGAAGAGIRSNAGLCRTSGVIICATAHSGGFQNSKQFYCSELILEAFRTAGVSLVSHSAGVSIPKDFVTAHRRGKLDFLGKLVPTRWH